MLKKNKQEKIGKVVANSANKTIVVLVARKVKHPIYNKYINVHKRFMAHDENNVCQLMDIVKISETRPVSKRKKWRFVCVVTKNV